MKASDVPSKINIPFAIAAPSGNKNTIPDASQIGITNGLASWTDGFPPVTFTDVIAGGQPPFGADFNGVLNTLSDNARWSNASGLQPFDPVFSSQIGGYPKGAIVRNPTTPWDGGSWTSLIDDNLSSVNINVDGSWLPGDTGSTQITLSSGVVTLSPDQYVNKEIVLMGTLTGSATVVFPALWDRKEWKIVDNTTKGASTLTLKAISSIPVVVSMGGVYDIIVEAGGITLSVLNSVTTKVDKQSTLAVGVDLNTVTTSGMYNITSTSLNSPAGLTNGSQMLVVKGADNTLFQIIVDYNTGTLFARGGASGANAYTLWRQFWSAGNQGSGSGMDSDLLDSLQSTQFLRADIAFNKTRASGTATFESLPGGLGSGGGSEATLTVQQSSPSADAVMFFNVLGSFSLMLGLDGVNHDLFIGGGSLGTVKYPLWHEGQAGKSLVQNGYESLPDGVIRQWGVVAVTLDAGGVGATSVVLPITFPTAGLNASATCITTASSVDPRVFVSGLTTTSLVVHLNSSVSSQSINLYWEATGH